MSNPYEVSINITLRYNHEVDPSKVAEWVEGALDYCRQEKMLDGDVNVPDEVDLICADVCVNPQTSESEEKTQE